jgi:BMFP domain-containing protein YqiC
LILISQSQAYPSENPLFSKLSQKGSAEYSRGRELLKSWALLNCKSLLQGFAREAADDIEPAAQRLSEQLESASHEVAVKAEPTADRVADAISDTVKQASKDIPKAAERVSEDVEKAAKVCIRVCINLALRTAQVGHTCLIKL